MEKRKDIQEIERLYHKEYDCVCNGDAVALKRCTYEEQEKYRQEALNEIEKYSKQELIEYILGITPITFGTVGNKTITLS